MKNLLKNAMISLGVLSSAMVFAAGGDAGCGLGGLIMHKNSKVSQVLAITTNGSFSSQLFGVISGTSGCSASEIVQYKAEALKVAESNFESLKIDIARGGGESLNSVGSILGCRGANLQNFSKMSQENFLQIVPQNATPRSVIDALDMKIHANPELSKVCSVTT